MEKKKRLRDMNWDDYGMSKNRYRELKAFCLQYDEKKGKIKYGLSAVQYDGMPNKKSIGSGVEKQAIENSLLQQDCTMIEEAAKMANPVIWRYIVKSVTMDLSYESVEYDHEQGEISMCRNDFYGTRRLFFAILHKMKQGYKLTAIP